MQTLSIPKFEYDFFDNTKSNAALASINYHPSEITPMIDDYFDYHRSSHPVCESIISLLNSLQKFSYCFDTIFINDVSAERYRELEDALLKSLKEAEKKSAAGEFKQDSSLLVDAIQYSTKVIANCMHEMQRDYPEIAATHLTDSPLAKYLNIGGEANAR